MEKLQFFIIKDLDKSRLDPKLGSRGGGRRAINNFQWILIYKCCTSKKKNSLRLKDCQAWFVNDNNLCRKREVIASEPSELTGYIRYDAVYKMISKVTTASLLLKYICL